MTASFHKEGVWVHKTRLTPSLCISLSISICHKQEKRIGHKLSIQFRLIPHMYVFRQSFFTIWFLQDVMDNGQWC